MIKLIFELKTHIIKLKLIILQKLKIIDRKLSFFRKKYLKQNSWIYLRFKKNYTVKKIQNLKPIKVIFGLITFYLLVVFISLLLSFASLIFLFSQQLTPASVLAKTGLPFAISVNRITFQKVAIINHWVAILNIITLLPEVNEKIKKIGNNYNLTGQIDLKSLEPMINNLINFSDQLDNNLIGFSQNNHRLAKAHAYLKNFKAWATVIHEIINSKGKALILIQGSDELRPGGGFMGAYIIMEWRDGLIVSWVFEDIYDAAGQAKLVLDPPPGVAEFTSSGKSWSLVDANWSSNFPTNAQLIQNFFTSADRGEFNYIISLNTDVLTEYLRIIGQIELPEYQTTLNVETIEDLLSKHRTEYFPGSRQKATMLSQIVPHLLSSVSKLNPTQINELIVQFLKHGHQKNIQIFSINPEIQNKLIEANLAGSTESYASFYQNISGEYQTNKTNLETLQLIEANVGINKINSQIEREINVNLSGEEIIIDLNLINTSEQKETPVTSNFESIIHNSNLSLIQNRQLSPAPEASHQAYVNYLRIKSSPGLILNQEKSGMISTSTFADSWKLLENPKESDPAFLIILRPGESHTYRFTFKRVNSNSVLLLKQSGVNTSQSNFVMDNNQPITFTFDQDIILEN